MLSKWLEHIRQGLKNDFENLNEEEAKKVFDIVTSFCCLLAIILSLITLTAQDIAEGGINLNDVFPFITIFIFIGLAIFVATLFDIIVESFYEFFVKKHLSNSPKTKTNQGISRKDEKLP